MKRAAVGVLLATNLVLGWAMMHQRAEHAKDLARATASVDTLRDQRDEAQRKAVGLSIMLVDIEKSADAKIRYAAP